MLFNSTQFMIFFPVVVLAYYLIPAKVKYLWLLAASYYFYMCWNAKYVLLLLFSTVVTWLSGLGLQAVQDRIQDAALKLRCKRWIVAGSVTANLAVLFFFKYFNFAMQSLAAVLARLHIQLALPTLDVLLPVGISFYTFQALSYTLDVYRGDIYAEKNFFRYALFVSFFPQLVAGPIERSKNLLVQLAQPKAFDFEAAREGFLLMLWGFFLKIVVADRIAIFVDTIYAGYYTGLYLAVTMVLFTFQIYCDFYGYSVIAMGAARILGIRLMENFNAPLFSTSVGEFWSRWHISLTSWLRDYLYIPLALANTKKITGGRWKHLPAWLCEILVFLCSGLWHGAAWNYVLWGGLNGLYIVTGIATRKLRRKVCKKLKINRKSAGWQRLTAVFIFTLVAFSQVFFRSRGLRQALTFLQRMFTVFNPWILWDGSLYKCGLDSKNFWLMLLCIGVLLFADVCKYRGVRLHRVIAGQRYWLRCLVITFAVCFILLFGIWGPGYSATNFIYFQF